jgi:hypothetical protein
MPAMLGPEMCDISTGGCIVIGNGVKVGGQQRQ